MQSCCFALYKPILLFTVLVALAVTVANHKLLIVIQEFYYHNNMTSHISSLLELC